MSPEDTTITPDTPATELVSVKRTLETVSEANIRYRKKIKLLQQTTRRLKKRNSSLRNIIKTLQNKNFLDEDNISVLKSVSGVNEELLSRQCAKVKGSPSPRKFGAALRAFAVTLNFYSPERMIMLGQILILVCHTLEQLASGTEV